MEFHALHQIVLGAFDNLQTATLQRIAESHGRGVTAYDGNSLNALRLISVNRLFCDGVDPRHQRNIYRAVCFGHDGLIYTVARNIEFDARYPTWRAYAKILPAQKAVGTADRKCQKLLPYFSALPKWKLLYPPLQPHSNQIVYFLLYSQRFCIFHKVRDIFLWVVYIALNCLIENFLIHFAHIS